MRVNVQINLRHRACPAAFHFTSTSRQKLAFRFCPKLLHLSTSRPLSVSVSSSFLHHSHTLNPSKQPATHHDVLPSRVFTKRAPSQCPLRAVRRIRYSRRSRRPSAAHPARHGSPLRAQAQAMDATPSLDLDSSQVSCRLRAMHAHYRH